MQRILRILAPLALLIAALALVACGGGDDAGGEKVSSDADVNTLLDQTFSGKDKKVDSGKVDMKLKLNVSGGGSSLNGPIDISLSGPFQSEGATKLPKFDLDVAFSGAGQNIKAGAESTGTKAFVNFNGEDYAVSEQVFNQFKQGFEQAAAQSQKQESSGQGLAQLGINPKNWLKDPKNDGDSSVEGTDTVKITGGIDVGKLLDDVNNALSKAGSLGIPNTGQLPTKLTDEQKSMVEEAVKSASVEIETGKEDSILRRLAFKMSIEDPEGSGGKADIDFEISLSGLNEDQEFPEPSDPKPFDELLGQLGGLGGLGTLGGASSSGGSSSSTGGTSSAAAQEYAACVQKAGTDTAAAQKCAEALTP